MKIDFMEAALGTKKDITLDVVESCPDCNGLGGFDKETCPYCNGRGVTEKTQNTIFGAIRSRVTCSNCGGSGYSLKLSVELVLGVVKLNKEKLIL